MINNAREIVSPITSGVNLRSFRERIKKKSEQVIMKIEKRENLH